MQRKETTMKKQYTLLLILLLCAALLCACTAGAGVTLTMPEGKSVSLKPTVNLGDIKMLSSLNTQMDKLIIGIKSEGSCEIKADVEGVGEVTFGLSYEKGTLTVTTDPELDLTLTKN